MSTEMIVSPLFRVRCDRPGCDEEFRTRAIDDGRARDEAKVDGWSVRPRGGAGSRSAPDLCPDHVEPEGGETP